MPKTTEQNRIVRTDKFEVEVWSFVFVDMTTSPTLLQFSTG